MADDPTKTPGSITQSADSQDQRISEVSNVNRAISNMQKQVNQKLTEIDTDLGSSEAIAEVQGSMTKVLNKMAATVGDIGKGFGSIAAETARGSKQVFSDYSKALQQDINYNKQNIVAMALAKSSPIFGYYASRFMETDVWKNAADRMKSTMGDAIGSVGQRFKSAFTGIKLKKQPKDIESTATKAKKTKEKVPHMQTGGYVEKGGLARLHAAEVVVPVEKFLSRMDDQISATRAMARTVERGQVRSLAKIQTYVGNTKEQRKGLIQSFLTALEEVQTQYEEPAQQRMLRALLAIQDTLGAQLGTWQQVWQKMLITNPVFRNAMITGNIMRKLFAAPFKPVYGFFRTRGGYESHLSSSGSPLEAMVENIGVLYTGSMHRLDRITLYTQGTAEAVRDLSSYVTGKKYPALPEIKTGIWSFFGGARGLINWLTKWSVKGAGWGAGIGKSKDQKLAIRKEADLLADKLTRSRDPFWKKWFAGTFGGQQEMLGAGLGAVGEDAAAGRRGFIQVFSNQKLLKYVDSQGALPMFSPTIAEMLTLEKDRFELENDEAKKSKKLLQITDENWRVNEEINDREKRRTVFGFLSGGFGAVKGLLSSVMGFLPMIGGLFGLGKLGGGGLPGMLTSILSSAFLGKGSAPGKGGILGSMAKRMGNFIKSIKIKFPKGFMGKIGPALLRGMGALRGLGATIATRFASLFAPGGAIVSALGPALAVAAAGVIGWKIGKKLDNVLGISEKFQEKMNEWDKKANALAAKVGAVTQENVKKAREGGREGYQARRSVGLMTDIGKMGESWQSDLGFFGRRHMVAISEAQKKYMQDNVSEYMKYHPDVVTSMRRQWIKEGGYYSKGIGENAAEYGRRREQSFLNYLKKKAKPMSAKEAEAHYDAYKKKFGIVDRMKMEAGDLYGTVKDKAGGAYIRVRDLANNQVKEMAITSEALRNDAASMMQKYSEGMKDMTNKVVGATQQQTVMVTNTMNQTANTAINQGKNAMNWGKRQLEDFAITGEVDGD